MTFRLAWQTYGSAEFASIAGYQVTVAPAKNRPEGGFVSYVGTRELHAKTREEAKERAEDGLLALLHEQVAEIQKAIAVLEGPKA